MADNRESGGRRLRWRGPLVFRPGDIGYAGVEERETGVEADERDRRYVQEGYATLSRPRELLLCGAWAGLQAGAVLVAIGAILLFAVAGFGQLIYLGSFVTDAPPFADALLALGPPLLAILPACPYFGLVGAIAAWFRRLGNQRRRALDHYFEPIRPLFDMLVFWVLASALVMWTFYAADLADASTDVAGLLFMAIMIGGGIGWVAYGIWQRRYLLLIRRHGSASFDEILGHIRRQA